MNSLEKRVAALTTLFDITAGETMTYCDNPSNCSSHVPIGKMFRQGYIYLNLDDGYKDFCSVECLFDWCLYHMDDGEEEDDTQ